MNRKFLWLGLIPLLLAACQLTATPTPEPTSTPGLPPAADQTYPLAAGAYWVYQGTVAYDAGGGKVVEETIQWRVEVVESTAQLAVTGYKMRGALIDLAFYTPQKQPGDYAIIQVGTNRFYNADPDTYARLNSGDNFLIGLVQERNLFLELPLVPGNRFCEAEQITRLDESYCWVVGQPETVSLEAAAGGEVQAYPIYYNTNPDLTTVYFAPGIGVVAFTYHHSGTVSDVQMALIEYRLGEAAP